MPFASPPLLLTESEHAAYKQELQRLRAARDKEKQAGIGVRISRLEELLSQATVVADGRDAETVCLGCTVEVQYTRTGQTAAYRLIGAHTTAEPGTVSSRSPVGSALIGRRAGEVVTVELPGGRAEQLTIVAIAPAGKAPDR